MDSPERAGSPFVADPAVAARMAALAPALGPEASARLAAAAAARTGPDAGDRGVVPAAEAAAVVAALGLATVEELMLLALPYAAQLARPPISGFVVGAVGLEAERGDLLLGGNVEFPGASLALTLHGEGAVALRAFGRGTALSTLAIRRARPCAHCRQVLTEFAWAGDLRLIDPLGHTVALDDLYPWPFAPGDLDVAGIVPGAEPWPDLELGPVGVPDAVAALLVGAGRRSHAPYSRAPAAAVLALPGGGLVAGASLESVAFNPSIGPVSAALPEVLARGHELAEVRAVWLAVPAETPVDHATVTHQLLAAAAPGATLHVVHWS